MQFGFVHDASCRWGLSASSYVVVVRATRPWCLGTVVGWLVEWLWLGWLDFHCLAMSLLGSVTIGLSATAVASVAACAFATLASAVASVAFIFRSILFGCGRPWYLSRNQRPLISSIAYAMCHSIEFSWLDGGMLDSMKLESDQLCPWDSFVGIGIVVRSIAGIFWCLAVLMGVLDCSFWINKYLLQISWSSQALFRKNLFRVKWFGTAM